MLKVEYQLEISQEQVKVGEPFVVTLLARDLRPWGTYFNSGFEEEKQLIRGVFAAYCSILFDKSKVRVNAVGTPGTAKYALSYRSQFIWFPPYTNGKVAVDIPIGTRLGAFSTDFDGVDEDRAYPVCSITLLATKPGLVILQTTSQGLRYPMDDTLVYGNLAVDPPEQSNVLPLEITWQRASIQVVA